MKNHSEIVYLAWAPYNRRAECFARELGAELCLINYIKYRSPHLAPIKYPLMAIKTFWVLCQKKPKVVFSMTPPLFCVFFVYLYCLYSKAKYIIDAHTGSLVSQPWLTLRFLHKFLCRKAAVTVVTNPYLVNLIQSWGAKSIDMNPPVVFPKLSPKKLVGKHNVLFVNSFAPDEPLEEIVQVARFFNEICFYITGDLSKAPKKTVGNAPKNVFFTGFVSNEEYIRLMTSVDGVLCFTTRDHTLLSGGEEALFMGKPLLTFGFSFLKSFFNLGAVFVEPSIEAIRKGVVDLIQNRKKLSQEMMKLREIKLKNWGKDLIHLNKIICE